MDKRKETTVTVSMVKLNFSLFFYNNCFVVWNWLFAYISFRWGSS